MNEILCYLRRYDSTIQLLQRGTYSWALCPPESARLNRQWEFTSLCVRDVSRAYLTAMCPHYPCCACAQIPHSELGSLGQFATRTSVLPRIMMASLANFGNHEQLFHGRGFRVPRMPHFLLDHMADIDVYRCVFADGDGCATRFNEWILLYLTFRRHDISRSRCVLNQRVGRICVDDFHFRCVLVRADV
jgi:hypothetical protein